MCILVGMKSDSEQTIRGTEIIPHLKTIMIFIGNMDFGPVLYRSGQIEGQGIS